MASVRPKESLPWMHAPHPSREGRCKKFTQQ